MTRRIVHLLALLALLSGCAFADRTLWPTLAGEGDRASPGSATATLMQAEDANRPNRAAPPTREEELAAIVEQSARRADEAMAARGALEDATRAHRDAADALARAGTGDPNRPALLARADATLAKRAEAVGRLAALAALAASDAAAAGALAAGARAEAAQPGASTEDRQRLAAIARDASAAAAESDRLVAELGSLVARESRQIAELRGALPASQTAALMPFAAPAERRPLVVIRFERPDQPYEQELRYAVGEALRRRPEARFDVVAAAPPGGLGEAAKRNVEGVVRRLAAMGVPAARLTLSATTRADAKGDEVFVYVR
ncbi:MAG: hypothetical protein IRZ04_01005 [Rhodospirillales bacterium]|nr:hypothetical protein [Rhodospirillales bacterium]